ncbi:MAG: phenylalanine--tRNA ligase subunit alpha [Bdellovibrionales bacterium]|nr:phenylalanine--tRNA ligase subunit alpha [Bdellovibrionales bacterium]
MLENIDSIQQEFEQSLSSARDKKALSEVKQNFLGKKGQVSALMGQLKSLDPDERKVIGEKLHILRSTLDEKLQQRFSDIERDEVNEKLSSSWQDPSRRGSLFSRGLEDAGLHPITQILHELEDIFSRMGFEVLDGPHIEDDFHNFTALNIPEAHPARDLQDTFWFEDGKHLLRTHTSCIQIRGMKNRKPPVKYIGPGQVFRCERTDQWHDFSFFQLEGLFIDKDVSVAHLLYFAKTLFEEIFKSKVEIRTRPSYFPFVEPGLEIDMRRDGGKWVEMLGSGMIHPRVLEHLGVDSEVYSGFAFGLGVDRLLLMRHAIEDIRHLRSGDLRFVKQFSGFRAGGIPC